GEQIDAAVDERRQLARVERMIFSAQRIARGIMLESFVPPAKVMERLAECKLHMKAVPIVEIVALQQPLHRRHVSVGEAHRLEVGEAPPNLTYRGIDGDRLAIGIDRLLDAPETLSHVGLDAPRL